MALVNDYLLISPVTVIMFITLGQGLLVPLNFSEFLQIRQNYMALIIVCLHMYSYSAKVAYSLAIDYQFFIHHLYLTCISNIHASLI